MQRAVEVIRHDKVIYDKRNYDMNNHLKYLQFRSKTVDEEFIHKN